MSTVLVLGGGVVGLATALMLFRRGHEVIVLERDNQRSLSSPEEAWCTWERRGVTQFRQPHYLHPSVRHLLDAHLPEVKEALVGAGCVGFDALTTMPQFITDRSPRKGDAQFVTVTGRRPTIEYAIANLADRFLTVRHGVSIGGLLTGPAAANGIPHIIGVRTAIGEVITADLVIDAMGRGSKIADFLETAGARRPIEEAEDSGFIYYTRFFRSISGKVPSYRAPISTSFDSFSVLTLPGDADTWAVTVFISSSDPALKKLRDSRHWTALVASCLLQAHWLEGEPITDVLPMAGIIDRYRRFVVDGLPVATGIISVGDAWACTNPSLARGIAMGLMHAVGTVEVVQQHLDNPIQLALAQDSMTETRVTPWYRNTVDIDRARISQVNACIDGRPPPQPADQRSRIAGALSLAMMYDADLFRAALEIRSLLTLPQEVMARPGIVDRIKEVANACRAVAPPGPSRAKVLQMLA